MPRYQTGTMNHEGRYVHWGRGMVSCAMSPVRGAVKARPSPEPARGARRLSAQQPRSRTEGGKSMSRYAAGKQRQVPVRGKYRHVATAAEICRLQVASACRNSMKVRDGRRCPEAEMSAGSGMRTLRRTTLWYCVRCAVCRVTVWRFMIAVARRQSRENSSRAAACRV